MEQYDPRVDAYIFKAAPFARPILEHIRKIVHEASPLITETIKWSCPFFDYKGPVCQMAAFKQHCAFGFWKATLLNDPDRLLNPGEEAAAGSFGRLNSLADLPGDEVLKQFIIQAIALNEAGEKLAKKDPAEKPTLAIPDYFIEFLSASPAAIAAFNGFSNSHKKEYAEWISDAKSDATRQKRMETALEWISEGKSRNWKYK